MGCDALIAWLCGFSGVSIHAPTWGATQARELPFFERNVSIHAPTWGATHKFPHYAFNIQSFNPRTHMGCDV